MFLNSVSIDDLKNFKIEKAEAHSSSETCRIKGCGTPIKNVFTLSDNKGNYTLVGSECVKKIAEMNNSNSVEC